MKQVFFILMTFATAITFTSCGTLTGSITGNKRPVWLMQAPNDIEVKANGELLEVNREYLASNESSGSSMKVTTNYFTKGIRLPYKKNVDVELYSPSTRQRAKFTLRSKSSALFFWGNLFVWPVVGHVVDATTKNNHLLKPRYIDVEYALQGKPVSEWRGKNKLMRNEKRSIRKG